VLWLLLGCTLLNFALSVEQNRLPPGHILNRYASDETQIVAERSGVRATGTFAYITGLGVMSTMGVWTGIALMGVARNHWERGAAWVALGAGFGCGLASISRAPVYSGVAMLAACFVFSSNWRSKLNRGLLVGVLLVAIATAFGLSVLWSSLQKGWVARDTATRNEIGVRVFGQIGESLGAAQEMMLGEGFGTHQAGGHYSTNGEKGFVATDNQFPRMICETGVAGLVGYLIICAGAILALQAAKRTATSGMKTVVLATQLFLLETFYTACIFNHTASAFAWFIFAAVLSAKE